jgi:hypothetical protein
MPRKWQGRFVRSRLSAEGGRRKRPALPRRASGCGFWPHETALQNLVGREFIKPLFTRSTCSPIRLQCPLRSEIRESLSRRGVNRRRSNLRRSARRDSFYKSRKVCALNHMEGPMRSSFCLFTDPQAAIARNCLSQLIVSLSALASTAILLTQLLPTMLAG